MKDRHGDSNVEQERIRREAEQSVLSGAWNRMPEDPNRRLCGADDGSTVCILPVDHPIGHRSQSGRVWL